MRSIQKENGKLLWHLSTTQFSCFCFNSCHRNHHYKLSMSDIYVRNWSTYFLPYGFVWSDSNVLSLELSICQHWWLNLDYYFFQFGKVLIPSETWSKRAPGQIVSRIRFSHSTKCSIGVHSSPDVFFLFPLSTVPSEHPVYERLSGTNATFL